MTTQSLSPSLASLIQKHNLDISIVELNDVENRMDSDFFSTEYVSSNNLVRQKGYKDFGDIIEILTDYHANGSYEILRNHVELLDNKDYALMVRTVDLETENFEENVKWITNHAYDFLKKTKIFWWEIIINKVGSAGKVYLMPKLNRPVSLGMNAFMLRIKPEFDTNYIYAFLVSKHWANLIKQRITWAVPPSIDKQSVRSIKIPLPSLSFQSSITSLIQTAHSEREKSKFLYAEAEKIVLDALDLSDWKPTDANIDIKTSEEVRLFGRCDAEFFQPKYDELFARLSKFEVEELGDIVDYIKGVEPWTDEYTEHVGVPFVRVSDVNIQGIKGIEKMVSLELAKGYNGKYSPKKDDILFTKDGTIGISFVVNEDMNAVLSGAFLMLRKKKQIESEYLALILNSIICKLQIERLSGGAIIAHLKPSDAMTLRIPILSPAIQSKISSLIVSSHEARTRSKELLERAKRAVEVFVEEDEEVAKKEIEVGLSGIS